MAKKNNKMTGNTVRLLELLKQRFKGEDNFFISNKVIADELNCSPTGASLLIKRLREEGLLVITNKTPRLLSLKFNFVSQDNEPKAAEEI